MMKFKIISILSLIIFATSCGAQKSGGLFETNKDYFDFIDKKYGISSNLVIYTSTEGMPLNSMGKFGLMLFVTDGRIASINEVSDNLKVKCAPKELFTKVTEQAINESSGEKIDLENFVFKKMATGERISLSGEKKFVLYIFSQRFKKYADLYFKDRIEIEKKLGYKTYVLSIDGAYLKEIKDIDKEPVNID